MKKNKRVLLKVSGESLVGANSFGIDQSVVSNIANDIYKARSNGYEIAIVIGGGNIVRGAAFASSDSERVTGDHMGMLATVINALALRSALTLKNVPCVVFSAIAMPQICEVFTQHRVMKAVADSKVVIFAAGTGNPYFTTDTAATLRAAEIGADLLVKATKVDGVYDSDPKLNPSAKHIKELSYDQAVERNLAVMDLTAITLAKANKIPVLVYSMTGSDGLLNVLNGQGKFSLVH